MTGFLKEAGGSVGSTTYQDLLECATDTLETVYPMHWPHIQALLASTLNGNVVQGVAPGSHCPCR